MVRKHLWIVRKATNKDVLLNESGAHLVEHLSVLNISFTLDQLSCRKGAVPTVVVIWNGNPPWRAAVFQSGSSAAICLPQTRTCDCWLLPTYPGQEVKVELQILNEFRASADENNHLSLVFKAFFLLSSCTYLFRYRHTLSLGSIAIMCGFCKPPQSLEATKGCADCKSNFCNECFKLYHPWGTPRAQHEHIPPTNHFRPKVCLQLSPTLSAVTTTAPQSSSCFRF